MAGIYIHIPFCKRICSYCDFYKTTAVSLIPEYITALEKELEKRVTYLSGSRIDTIYVGGGTPSLMAPGQVSQILGKVYQLFAVAQDCEITIEANPDDLSRAFLDEIRSHTPVNRISIGIQSLNDLHLKLLNRRHTATQALNCIEVARSAGFNNISIDMIYGIPGMGIEDWKKNLEMLPDVEHISAYHLTIEPGTVLAGKIARGLLSIAREEESALQFSILGEFASRKGFIHYEISNLAREGRLSRHNSNYWKQSGYLGIGPSAHSYDLTSRQWNFPRLKDYLEAMKTGSDFFEREILSIKDRFNEYLMLSLRTMWGIEQHKLLSEFGEEMEAYFLQKAQKFLNSGHIVSESGYYKMTREGWLISDYILSGLVK